MGVKLKFLGDIRVKNWEIERETDRKTEKKESDREREKESDWKR